MPDQKTDGGSVVYHHAERVAPPAIAHGDAEHIAAIERHLEAHLGRAETVFHEIVSDLVHIDVHPIRGEACTWLVTTGMSDLPMTVPEGAEEWRHAEVMIALPSDWPLTPQAWKDERHYWPIRLLKGLARLPHLYATWLGEGHTVPNGDPPAPYAPGTGLCCALLLPALDVPEGFTPLALPDRTIHFLQILPIHRFEMERKLLQGTDALLDLFDEHELSPIVDPARPDLARRPRKGWLGRF
jgi:hypothetical protein